RFFKSVLPLSSRRTTWHDADNCHVPLLTEHFSHSVSCFHTTPIIVGCHKGNIRFSLSPGIEYSYRNATPCSTFNDGDQSFFIGGRENNAVHSTVDKIFHNVNLFADFNF